VGEVRVDVSRAHGCSQRGEFLDSPRLVDADFFEEHEDSVGVVYFLFEFFDVLFDLVEVGLDVLLLCVDLADDPLPDDVCDAHATSDHLVGLGLAAVDGDMDRSAFIFCFLELRVHGRDSLGRAEACALLFPDLLLELEVFFFQREVFFAQEDAFVLPLGVVVHVAVLLQVVFERSDDVEDVCPVLGRVRLDAVVAQPIRGLGQLVADAFVQRVWHAETVRLSGRALRGEVLLVHGSRGSVLDYTANIS